MIRKLALLFWCASTALAAYICFDYWSFRHAKVPVRFQSQWRADVANLEASGKLPKAWHQVKEIKLVFGSPEARDWLAQMKPPLRTLPTGNFRMEVLIVPWSEGRKRGALIQYNLEDLKDGNTVAEISRTLVLEDSME